MNKIIKKNKRKMSIAFNSEYTNILLTFYKDHLSGTPPKLVYQKGHAWLY